VNGRRREEKVRRREEDVRNHFRRRTNTEFTDASVDTQE
jgi:hypothetical protein